MSLFKVIEHIVPAQHIREYPRALSGSQDVELRLALKQYVPKDSLNPLPGDITIIAAHANGFVKELYEPLWDELLPRIRKCGVNIRGIWIADVAHQGKSGHLNRELLGNDPSWFDHSRDLLHIINSYRKDMPRPLVGIGHSGGAGIIANLSFLHPRLFTTVVLLDPVVSPETDYVPSHPENNARKSTFRRDVWPSREMAAERFRAHKYYQTWDPRVLGLFIQHGLQDLPSNNDSNSGGSFPNPVTLTTSKAQEVFTYYRPNFEGYGLDGKPIDRTTHADLDPQWAPLLSPFYRGESAYLYSHLPILRPSVLYVFGGASEVCKASYIANVVRNTGIGVGGSGGVQEDRVRYVVLEKIGHLVAQEDPVGVAKSTAEWIGREMERWRELEKLHHQTWILKSGSEKQAIDDEFKRRISNQQQRLIKESKI